MGLQVADEDEQQKKSSKKKKKKRSEGTECGAEERGVEHWVEQRQRKKARKEEEAQKRKRTVFVGNLPVSCTKKVGGAAAPPSRRPAAPSDAEGTSVLFQMLQNLFKDEGSIQSIRFRSVVSPASGA